MKRTLFVLVVIVLLAACSPSGPQPPTGTPTSSLMPTITSTSTIAPTSTRISIFEIPGSPEEFSAPCQIGSFFEYYAPEIRGSSPDGTWRFLNCLEIYDQETHSHYVMYNTENPYKSWLVTNEEITSPFGSIAPFGWYVAAWSENTQNAYMVYEKFCEFYPGCSFVDAQLVYEMNMASHLVTEVLSQDSELSVNYALAFSPDSQSLAYIQTGTQELFIKSLETIKETSIQLDDSELSYGDISWSPDGTRLVMMSSSREDVFDLSLWIIDLNLQTAIAILSEEERDFNPVAWVDDDTIFLYLWSGGPNVRYEYLYIVSTGELILADADQE